MKALFGIGGLLLVVVIVAVLARNQLASVSRAPAVPVPGATSAAAAGAPQQQVQQFKQAVEGAMQVPARAMPDDNQ